MKTPTPAEWRNMKPAEKIAVCEAIRDTYGDERQIAAINWQIAWYKQQQLEAIKCSK